MTAVAAPPKVAEQPEARDNQLEGLRAIAALAVTMTHAGFLSGQIGRDVLPGPVARLDIGVAIFFVLSGFLLYRPHARHHAGLADRPGLRRYAVRRAFRLFPALLPVIAATYFLVPESRTVGAAPWLANLVQVQAVRSDWLLPGLAQLWSLSTEVMFYLALPLIAAVIGKLARGSASRELAVLALLTLTAWGSRVVLHTEPGQVMTWDRTLVSHLDWFAGGMAIAVVRVRPELHARVRAVSAPAVGSILAVAASLFWVLSTSLAGPFDLSERPLRADLFKHIGYAVFAVLVVAPAALLSDPVLQRVLAGRRMVALGAISYGIFLWHLPIMFFVRETAGWPLFGGKFWLTWIITLALTIPVAQLSWRFLEAPILAWARRF